MAVVLVSFYLHPETGTAMLLAALEEKGTIKKMTKVYLSDIINL